MSPSKPTLRAAYNNVYVLAVKHGLTRLRAVGQPPCSLIGAEALNPLLFSVTSVSLRRPREIQRTSGTKVLEIASQFLRGLRQGLRVLCEAPAPAFASFFLSLR
jgi:hypothetical protein